MASVRDYDSLSRKELLEEARSAGIDRPERMTRVELRDEMIRRTVAEDQQDEARGLFGVARSMLASVVETGLNLPDAAKVIRGDSSIEIPAGSQAPVATVTLAEIYAAQGHKSRALRMIDEVLKDEPEHEEALRVRAELTGGAADSGPRSAPADPREALTAEPPAVAPVAATPDYVPGGFVETTGEEIKTGKPPLVETREQPTQAAPLVEPLDERPAEASSTDTPAAQAPPVEAADMPEESVPPSIPEILDEPAPQAVEAVAPAEPESSVDDAEPASAEPASAELDSAEPEIPAVQSAPLVALSPVLILAQSKDSLSLYWELPDSALEQCGVDQSEGDAAVRLVAFTPSGTEPVRSERTILLSETMRVDGPKERGAGALNLEDFGSPAAVRAALGWATDDGFLPLSVGRSVEDCGADRTAGELMTRAASHL